MKLGSKTQHAGRRPPIVLFHLYETPKRVKYIQNTPPQDDCLPHA